MRKWLGGMREWIWLLAAALFFLAALLIPFTAALAEPFTAEERQLLSAYERGEIIRLHVVANSDSPYDQAVKLAVRDAVIHAFGTELASAASESFSAACDTLQSHLSNIETAARLTARQLGFTGAVNAETGVLFLPEKHYGSIALPEGKYHALRITLGSGKGQNWWCVLFPQLCLSLAGDTKDHPPVIPRWHSRRILQNWLLCDLAANAVHDTENML